MNELERSSFPQYRKDTFAEPSTTLHDLALIVWRRLWIVILIMAVCLLTAAVLSKRTPKAWRASAQVLLVQRGPLPETAAQSVYTPPMVESIDTQVRLLQNREIARQAGEKVGVSADALLGASTVTPGKDGDNVMDVSVEAGSRQDAVNWANALCETFVQYKKQVAQSDSQDNLEKLQFQAQQAQKQMTKADAQLLTFQQTHHMGGVGVLDPVAQKSAALNAVINQDAVVATLENEYQTTEAKAAALSSQLRQAKAAINGGSGVRDDNQVIKLQESLSDMEQQRDELIAKGYKPNFPGKLGPLIAQIADTKFALKSAEQNLQDQPSLAAEASLQEASDNANSDALAARVRLSAASQQRRLLQGETTDLPLIGMNAGKLMENSDQAHKLYNTLNAALQAAQLDKDVASGNVQIVQPAFAPEEPIRPSFKRDLLVGLGIGLCLSLLAVLLMEQGDRSLRSASDVRRMAEGPVVAVLPQMTRAQRGQFMHGETPPHLIETYNAVRANLGLAMRQHGGIDLDEHQVILVTSAIPGEGKSLTATELAQSYARAGRRVVLINADMRRSSSLPLLKPQDKSTPGLAEVLAGEAGLEDALTTSKTANLSVVHSGHATQNPMDLISQPRMAETLKSLRDVADVIILDSPPAAVVADALLLAPLADCVLYVVGVGMADTESVRQTAAALSAASPKMLAYFVNRVPHLIGEPASYAYSDYGSPGFAPVPFDGSQDIQSSRTMMLNRPYTPEAGTVSGAAVVNGHKPVGPTSPLRVLPKVGTRLTTLEGPYLGQNFALSPSKPLSLGGLPDRDIVLARDVTVSQIHARIVPEEGRYVVFDDGSTNGTLVNDIPIVEHVLEVGDVLQLGASKFRYE